MGKINRTWAAAAALTVIAPLALTACSGDGTGSRLVNGKHGKKETAQPFSLAITPASNAKNLPLSTEIGTSVSGGKITSVALTEVGGRAVSGKMRDDGISWLPDTSLKPSKTYQANVTAITAAGKTETRTTTFTTMKSPEAKTTTSLYMTSKTTYGVAMPVVVEFDPPVPAKSRAAVQKRLFVTTDPPQPGTWSWEATGKQVSYRAPEYWKPGTKISTRVALGGLPMGKGHYGDTDRSASATIGDKFELKIENRTKRLSAIKGGKVIKRIPVSLGKPSTPSSSGTMVVMERHSSTIFDTFAELGAAGYRVQVAFAERLTWGGEFIHAAPWSVWDQGERNVSHGCINVSTANAAWLYNRLKVGDPVTVTGTEHKLDPGNGFTAWNVSWAEFVKGSALPVPANVHRSPSASPSSSGVPASSTPSPKPTN